MKCNITEQDLAEQGYAVVGDQALRIEGHDLTVAQIPDLTVDQLFAIGINRLTVSEQAEQQALDLGKKAAAQRWWVGKVFDEIKRRNNRTWFLFLNSKNLSAKRKTIDDAISLSERMSLERASELGLTDAMREAGVWEERKAKATLGDETNEVEVISNLPDPKTARVRAPQHSLDFVPTPKEVTLALLQRERFDGTIWEPACGRGDIARLLPEHTLATDLGDYGYGQPGVDFLKCNTTEDNIITNAPFSSMLDFKRKALQLARKKVALLMYCRQLGGEVESGSPLKHVYLFDRKINFEGASIGWLMAWYVWQIGYQGPITVERIRLGEECRVSATPPPIMVS